jgi:hypothetical protein
MERTATPTSTQVMGGRPPPNPKRTVLDWCESQLMALSVASLHRSDTSAVGVKPTCRGHCSTGATNAYVQNSPGNACYLGDHDRHQSTRLHACIVSSSVRFWRTSRGVCARPGPRPEHGDAGNLRHLLPTVSDTRMLIKASFNAPLAAAPTLRVGDYDGEWPHERYARRASGISMRPGCSRGAAIRCRSPVATGGRCRKPWGFPRSLVPMTVRKQFRVLFYTCAGGHEAVGKQPNTGAQPSPAARSEFPARRGSGERRSCLLGPARSGGRARIPNAGGIEAGRQIRSLRGGARQRQ